MHEPRSLGRLHRMGLFSTTATPAKAPRKRLRLEAGQDLGTCRRCSQGRYKGDNGYLPEGGKGIFRRPQLQRLFKRGNLR